MDLRVVFMGSPEFAIPTMEALNKHTKLVGVVTQPDRRAGRGRLAQPCPVKQRADELALPTFQPFSLKKTAAVSELAKWQPDLIVVAAFGQILPQAVLELPKFGCLNVHASLLPRWRGAAPIQAALAAGDQRSGVSIMLMDAGLDTGGVLAQREVPIKPHTTADSLSAQLAELGAILLIETLPAYLSGKLKPQPQDDSASTYAPKLTRADGLLDFEEPGEILARKVFAYQPWPGTYFLYHGRQIKVLEAHTQEILQSQPGARYVVNKQPALGTSTGLLVLDRVQPEGKRPMDGREFLNGQADWLTPG